MDWSAWWERERERVSARRPTIEGASICRRARGRAGLEGGQAGRPPWAHGAEGPKNK
jgi:hypothetical protein